MTTTSGYALAMRIELLEVERDTLRVILDAVDVACFGVDAPRLAYAALPAHITHVKQVAEAERDTLKAERDNLEVERDAARDAMAFNDGCAVKAEAEVERLRAVVLDVEQQMRAAANILRSGGFDDGSKRELLRWADTLAAALKEQAGK